jgi:hypothetical protein
VFRQPLHRDPLVVGWVIVMMAAGFVALNNNTEWSGHLEPDRVAGFLGDLANAFLWFFLLLLLAAWLRAKRWGPPGVSPFHGRAAGGRPGPTHDSSLPWTDRWLRDWREEEAQQRIAEPRPDDSPRPVTCRHGQPVGGVPPHGRLPVLRALAISHPIVRPGSYVSVTWCFQDAEDVVVDGRGGYPTCGEAPAWIDRTRQVEVVGRNRYGYTAAATAAVVAMAEPQVHLPTLASPPPVHLRSDVTAAIAGQTPVALRLDQFWAAQDGVRPEIDVPKKLVGVPSAVTDRLRNARRLTGMGT